jgi:hypothetical protein
MVERWVLHNQGRTISDDRDHQVFRLLEEIRDIQKKSAVNHRVALQNQQEAMAIQKQAVQRSQAAFVGLVVLLIFRGGPTSRLSFPGFSFGPSGTKRPRFGLKPVHTGRSVRDLSSTSTTMV